MRVVLRCERTDLGHTNLTRFEAIWEFFRSGLGYRLLATPYEVADGSFAKVDMMIRQQLIYFKGLDMSECSMFLQEAVETLVLYMNKAYDRLMANGYRNSEVCLLV